MLFVFKNKHVTNGRTIDTKTQDNGSRYDVCFQTYMNRKVLYMQVLKLNYVDNIYSQYNIL
jgi:hypothetical protein